MSEFVTVFPGRYTPSEQKVVDEMRVRHEAIANRGPVDIQAVISGSAGDIPGVEKTMEVTRKEMMYWVKYDPDNPLYRDEPYAKRTHYGNIIAFPTLPSQGCHFYGKVPAGMGDVLVVNGLCQSRTFHRPVYEGDTLYCVMDETNYEDITPKEGSIYRTIVTSGSGKVYNQKGELVMEGHGRCKESQKTFLDQKMKPPLEKMPMWEDPDWQGRPVHYYTDKDWEHIRALWKQEPSMQDPQRYYEDIKVGTSLPIGVYGPVCAQGDFPIFFLPVEAAYLKKNMEDPAVFETMIRDEYDGIYRTPEEAHKLPPPDKRGGKRPVFENSLARQFAAKTLINWAGIQGWLFKIDWRIMPVLPGEGYDGIPNYSDWPAPLNRVPGMEGKYADCHGLSGDLCEVHAYVADKFQKDGKNLVDIVWWCTTILGEIYEEGTALVELPTREERS